MLNMTLTCNLKTKIMSLSYDYYWKLELHYVSA